MTTTVAGGEFLTADGLRPGTITITDDIISSVTSSRTVGGLTSESSVAGGVVDGTGLIVAPGFIDLQINGGFGFDLADDPQAMWQLGRELPLHGVTAFLPTIISGPAVRRSVAMQAVRQRPPDYVGAEPLGLHFEGPMLSPQRPGAHPVQHLAPPSREIIDGWSADNGVTLVTIAPELVDATDIITELADRGVTVSAGHTDATADQARAGLAAGITTVTHLFNAMAPLGHRVPNLAGVALATKGLSVGLIVDGVHVDPTVVAATWNAKGPDELILLTDAVAPMGRGPGRYGLGDSTVTADETCVRNDAGTLAGSILTMDQAVRNLIAYTRCPTGHALASASTSPAKLIGETNRGRIQPGAKADLTFLDQDLRIQLTICGGQVAYVTESAGSRLPNKLPRST